MQLNVASGNISTDGLFSSLLAKRTWEKNLGNFDVEWLCIILVFEADCNFILKGLAGSL